MFIDATNKSPTQAEISRRRVNICDTWDKHKFHRQFVTEGVETRVTPLMAADRFGWGGGRVSRGGGTNKWTDIQTRTRTSSVGISRRELGGGSVARRRRRRDRDAHLSTASRERGMGRGCPPPWPTRASGSVVTRKLPQRGPGRSPPGWKRVLVHFEL